MLAGPFHAQRPGRDCEFAPINALTTRAAFTGLTARADFAAPADFAGRMGRDDRNLAALPWVGNS
jgi:hypothetical protein